MTLYCGIDLHSNNSIVVVTNESDQVVFQSRFPNELDLIRQALQPFQAELAGVVVESTYNWYWLVDGLMDAGFSLHLANPAAIKQYQGLKHSDDPSDARWSRILLYATPDTRSLPMPSGDGIMRKSMHDSPTQNSALPLKPILRYCVA